MSDDELLGKIRQVPELLWRDKCVEEKKSWFVEEYTPVKIL